MRRRGWHWVWSVGVCVSALCMSACATGGGGVAAVVMPQVLPDAAPEGLTRPDGVEGGVVVQHTDGFYYAMGLGAEATPGADVVLTYGGEWTPRAGKRPMVAWMHVAKVYDGADVALVQPVYRLSGVELQGATAKLWTEREPPKLGKGLGVLSSVKEEVAQISIGGPDGVQEGDTYVVLGPADGGQRVGERVKGLVKVTRVEKRGSVVEVMRREGVAGAAAVGDWLLFFEHGDARPPLQAVVEVSPVIGASKGAHKVVANQLRAYLKAADIENVSVSTIDDEVDPLDPDFGRELAGREVVQTPRMLLSGRMVKGRMVFNYTGTGLSVAHGMIAATPEKGLDAGKGGDVRPKKLATVFHNLVPALLTHRGENGRAMLILEKVLAQPGWEGPNRWHARDQLAMRWSQAGAHWEAIRMVQQDVARGEARGDKAAVINAVGTLMPIYEEIDRMELSLDAAERFFTLRKELGEGIYTDHARRSFIETLYKSGRTEDAEREMEKFKAACQPAIELAEKARSEDKAVASAEVSCVLDLYYMLMTFYWNDPTGDPDRRAQRLEEAEGYVELHPRLSKGSVRLIQAMKMLGEGDFDGSEVGFLEARRLFEKEGYVQGMARVNLLSFNLFMARGDRQQAFEAALIAADTYARVRDTRELMGAYRTMLRLYVNVPMDDMSYQAYARAASEVMSEALRLQFAGDDLGNAAEVFFVSGRFLLGVDPERAVAMLQRASELALRTVRFDIAALSRMTMALVAKQAGDVDAFQTHIGLAREYAQILGDASLLQSIEMLERGRQDQGPTTL